MSVEQNYLLEAYRSHLRGVVIEDALIIGTRGHKFILNSGKESDFYYDMKSILLDGKVLPIIGKMVYEELKNDQIDSIGGLETGAISIALATARESIGSDHQVRAFYVRKNPNEHGKFVEGNISQGDRVVIVDDVVTTGKALEETVNKLGSYGCYIVKAVCILDRQQGGEEVMRKIGIPFVPLLRHDMFEPLIEE